MNKDTRQAFPSAAGFGNCGLLEKEGMTRREYFAGQCVIALLSNDTMVCAMNGEPRDLAKSAVSMADMLIEELDK